MNKIMIVYILILFLKVSVSFGGCPSFTEMVSRLDGMQTGTPINVRTSNGEKLEGVVEHVITDPGSNKSYLVIRDYQGNRVRRLVSDLDPRTFKGPIDNVEPNSLIRFTSKSDKNYEGIYLGRKVIKGIDHFEYKLPDGRVGYVVVSRVNEASIRVIEAPMKTLSLPPNVLRPQGIDISSGKFITFQRGTEKIMARVKEIKTGVAGEKVTVEVLSRDGSFARVDLQGERLLSTIKAPSERSMRHLAPLFETPSGGVASSIPKPATVKPRAGVSPPPKVPQVADVPQRLPGAPEAKGPIPGLVSRKAPSPPDIPAPKSIGSPPVVAPGPKQGGGFFGKLGDFFRGRKVPPKPPVIVSSKHADGVSEGIVQGMKSHRSSTVVSRNSNRRLSGKVDKGIGNEGGNLNNHIEFRQIAEEKGLILDGPNATPNNLTPGKRYTYIIRDDGTMAFGQVDNTWEVGVKHMHLAKDSKVVAAGEVIKNADGTVTFNLESGTFTRKIKQSLNPKRDPLIDSQTDSLLSERVRRVFDHELGAGKSKATTETIFEGLKAPTMKDLMEYCKNKIFREYNGVFPAAIKNEFGQEGIVFPTHWCK